MVWLVHLLSQADHCAAHVQPWVAARLELLRDRVSPALRELDFTDDRLAAVLDYLARDEEWNAFESAFTQGLVRGYELPAETVRLDTTTVSSYRAPDSSAAWFRFGASKDHRADLVQMKLALATLDPLGLPLCSWIVPGDRADDPLYAPLAATVRERLGRTGVLYVGDCKMGALETRARLAQAGDFYLVPLSEIQYPRAEWEAALQPVFEGQQQLMKIIPPRPESPPHGAEESAVQEPPPVIASGFERARSRECSLSKTDPHPPEPLCWQERLLFLCSHEQARAGKEALAARLQRTLAALAELNRRGKGRKRYRTAEDLRDLQVRVDRLLARNQVEGLIRVRCVPLPEAGASPPSAAAGKERGPMDHRVEAEVEAPAVARAEQWLGWRVFATNAPAERLSLAQGFWAYRGQYRIEDRFARLKGAPLSLRPWYFQEEGRTRGLVRLLLLALQLLTLEQRELRRRLQEQGRRLAGIYAGNPKRASESPTVELVLRAFRGISRVRGLGGDGNERWHLARWTPQHRELLTLFGFDETIYHQLAPG